MAGQTTQNLWASALIDCIVVIVMHTMLFIDLLQGRTKGQGFQETPLDFTHYLKHYKIETLGFRI